MTFRRLLAGKNGRNTISTRAFLAISLFILFSDSLFIWFNYQSTWQAFEEELALHSANIRSSYEMSLRTISTNMQQIATYVASQDRVKELFLKGKNAVEKEGGGKGGPEAQAVRQALFDYLREGWLRMSANYDVRQLHFHLGPGSLSFLRVHAPTKYGDRMDDVRYTVVNTNKYQAPTKGFETGRVYSGIRGVVPVSARDPETGKEVHVGALEAGTSLAVLLDLLQSTFGAPFAALLKTDHLERNVWPEYLNRRIKEDSVGGLYVLEQTTSPDVTAILQGAPGLDFIEQGRTVITRFKEIPYALTAFPFEDYHESLMEGENPVGFIVSWRNIGHELDMIKKTTWFNILYGIVGFVLLELILFFSWRYSTGRLNRIIETRTSELEAANEQLEAEIIDKELAWDAQQQAERSYRSIYEHAPVGICSVDEEGRFISVNPAYAEMHGFESPEELMDNLELLGCDVFVDPGDWVQLTSLLVKNGTVEGFECRVKRKDGSILWTSRNARLRRDPPRGEIHVDSFVTDITERKKLEILREDVERMTRHDLKGPLTGVINLPMLIRLDGNLNERQQDHLHEIEEAGYRMLEMINSSLDLYKMETGSYQLRRDPVDVRGVIQKVAAESKGLAVVYGVEIRVDVRCNGPGPETSCTVMGEELLLYAMFHNLMRNALEASPRQEIVSVGIDRGDGQVEVSIHNSGAVPEDLVGRFFEKYSTSGKSGGTGLGTYTASLIAAIHGGVITLDTSESNATTLCVKLPAGLGCGKPVDDDSTGGDAADGTETSPASWVDGPATGTME